MYNFWSKLVFGGPSPVFCVLGICRTGLGSGPSIKGNRTRTRQALRACLAADFSSHTVMVARFSKE